MGLVSESSDSDGRMLTYQRGIGRHRNTGALAWLPSLDVYLNALNF